MRRLLLSVLIVAAVLAVLPARSSARQTPNDVVIAARQIPTCAAGSATPYLFFSVTDGLWHCTASAPVVYNGSTLTATAAELNLNHNLTATAAEVNVLHSVTAGTVAASKGVVVDASKAVDTLRARTDLALGGTGVPGAAVVADTLTKTVTAIADATATDVLTITVPNAAHLGQLQVCVTGQMGAGGAIGAGEAAATNCYMATIVRTAGVNAVGTMSSAFGAAAANVAGAGSVTATAALSAVAGAVGASNSFTVKITITKSGGSSANHVAFLVARVLNGAASGITIS